MNKKTVAIINLLGFGFILFASFLFSSNAFNSENIDVIFMPASYAFSIWGFIYVLLGIFVLRGFACTYKECDMYKKIMKFFVPCMILSGVTILVPLKISVFPIIGAFIMAYLCYEVVDNSEVSKLFRLPFSFLGGWLLVASILDIQLVLKSLGLMNLSIVNEINLVIGLLVILSVAIMFFSAKKDDLAVVLVLIWAIIAIGVKNSALAPIVVLAIGLVTVLTIYIIYRVVVRFLKRKA